MEAGGVLPVTDAGLGWDEISPRLGVAITTMKTTWFWLFWGTLAVIGVLDLFSIADRLARTLRGIDRVVDELKDIRQTLNEPVAAELEAIRETLNYIEREYACSVTRVDNELGRIRQTLENIECRMPRTEFERTEDDRE